MSIFRTDEQAALNNLLKAARETLDHYRDATELVETNHAQLFRNIAQQRRDFVTRLEEAVRMAGDLPVVPDPDKETGEMLIHHVAALLKSDYDADVIEQRIEAEKNLADLTAEAKNTEFEIPDVNLRDDFASHVSDTIAQLQHAHTQHNIKCSV